MQILLKDQSTRIRLYIFLEIKEQRKLKEILQKFLIRVKYEIYEINLPSILDPKLIVQ